MQDASKILERCARTELSRIIATNRQLRLGVLEYEDSFFVGQGRLLACQVTF